MRFTISIEVLQAVIAYLATKPYQEVFQLINALQSLQQDGQEKTS